MWLEENFKRVQGLLGQALQKSHRQPSDVKILAVTKTFSVNEIQAAYNLGLRHFGENYVQEALPKLEHFHSKDIQWHFIGHLQTNKVKLIANRFSLIHSVDSLKLGQEIQNRSTQTQKILVEINLGREASKTGVDPEAAQRLLDQLQGFDRIQVVGLMFMPPIYSNERDQREYFEKAQKFFLKCQAQVKNPSEFKELSMGTSGDYLLAVEYGATIVRLGTVLFGERKYE